ncbi:hypothetical protein THRCLA_05699, partial [Thraustotheca clavata]
MITKMDQLTQEMDNVKDKDFDKFVSAFLPLLYALYAGLFEDESNSTLVKLVEEVLMEVQLVTSIAPLYIYLRRTHSKLEHHELVDRGLKSAIYSLLKMSLRIGYQLQSIVKALGIKVEYVVNNTQTMIVEDDLKSVVSQLNAERVQIREQLEQAIRETSEQASEREESLQQDVSSLAGRLSQKPDRQEMIRAHYALQEELDRLTQSTATVEEVNNLTNLLKHKADVGHVHKFVNEKIASLQVDGGDNHEAPLLASMKCLSCQNTIKVPEVIPIEKVSRDPPLPFNTSCVRHVNRQKFEALTKAHALEKQRKKSSDEHHAPKASSLPSRVQFEYMDETTSSIRPRAPILPLTKPVHETESHRPRGKRMNHLKRKIKQSLTESLKSLELFGRNNLGRELGHNNAIMQTLVDPEGNVHFVNIDESTESLSIDDEEWKPFGQSIERENVDVAPSFNIPELPRGQRCVLNILSTWGDPYYVGLMGIEVFDHTGHIVRFSDVDKQLAADPSDINVNGSNSHDPRTIDKIVDGHNYTCDELHSWLAPFERGQNHYIYMDFDYPLSISMIRIWNYNTTRIHAYRGARYMEITLDGRFIFKGDIKRAVGAVESIESCCECILFTRNTTILQVIEKYEQIEEESTPRPLNDDKKPTWWEQEIPSERPKTGDKRSRQGPLNNLSFTRTEPGTRQPTFAPTPALSPFRPRTAPIARDKGADRPIICQEIKFFVRGNWGDPAEVGLAGLQILDSNFDVISIDLDCLLTPNASKLFNSNNITTNAEEMWLTSLTACLNSSEPFLVVNFGLRLSVGALKFWNYNASLEDSYKGIFAHQAPIDYTIKGIKRIAIMIDGDWMSPPEGFLIRKAPGNSNFDFGQFIQPKSHLSTGNLSRSIGSDFFQSETYHHTPPPTADPKRMSSQSSGNLTRQSAPSAPRQEIRDAKETYSMPKIDETLVYQQYHTPLFPCGCIVKIVIMSTWGDPFYVGLNGLELYDDCNYCVPISEDQIQAVPRDINVLPESKHLDARTLDKLYDGVNDTYDDCHMWLTPYNYCPTDPTVKIFIFFDEPIVLSKIMLWNYSKTPFRGVREYEIFMDDVLIYHGVLKKAQECTEADILSRRKTTNFNSRRKPIVPDMAQSVLFTNDPDILESESDAGHIYVPEEECETTFIDNSLVLSSDDRRFLFIIQFAPMAAELTTDFLALSLENFEAEPRFKLARNAVTSTDWGPALMDHSHVQSLNHVFSKRLVDTKICNQKASGRCWLFACSTLMRRALQKKYNLDPDFELSQKYLFFWDKLEKCNWCLENIIATADEPVDSRLVQYLLTDPTCDGGQWEMIVNIVEKYGVVPKNVYGECISSEMSVHLNTFLKSKLREFAEILRGMHANGVEIDEIREKKNEMMQIIHRIMIIHLGTPPTKFDFSVHDKEKNHVYFPDLTPQEFYAQHVDVKVSDMVSIVNDPRHDYNITMTVDK